MLFIKFLLATASIVFCCCDNSSITKQLTNKENDSSLSPKFNATFDYIIFGRFCGECGSNCAVMHRYNPNTKELFADYTDSYFKKDGNIVCKTKVSDSTKIILADSICKSIPDFLINNTNLSERFGCPDCTDGCGIYVEFKQSDKTKRFYIDHHSNELQKELQTFTILLVNIIDSLK
jgi:hypothetical protein